MRIRLRAGSRTTNGETNLRRWGSLPLDLALTVRTLIEAVIAWIVAVMALIVAVVALIVAVMALIVWV